MQVVKPGLIHQYANYDTTAHCEAHIACLEKLEAAAGAEIRAKANELIRKYGRIRSETTQITRECSGALDKVAPEGFYFGIPNVNSNMSGFWPQEWIAGATGRNPKGVPEAVARALGNAVIA